MNILILAKESHVGGLVKCTFNLAQGLSKKDNTKVVIGISPSNAIEPLRPYNLHEIDFESKSPFKMIGNYLRMARIIKKHKIDIIHAQNRLPALYAWLYCSFHKKVKYIWAILVVPIPTSFLYRITTKYGACAVTGNSEGERLLTEDLKIPKDKVRKIYQGIDLSNCTKTSLVEQASLKKRIGVTNDEKIILLYGRLDKIKGHEFLLEALRLIKDTRYKVVFPGENQEYKNHLIKIIKNYNLEDRVIFPGYISGREYLSISDLMVLPSIKEGLSLAFLEAISMGVPVIRTKTSAFGDIKDLCFGVDYGDVRTLSKLISDFLNGSEQFKNKAALAKKECYKFSLDNMVNSYYSVYCSALNKESC